MRVAVVYFSSNTQGRLSQVARAYAQGVGKQGHDVTLINGLKDSSNLFIYDYLLLGIEAYSLLSGKLDNSARQSLKNIGNISGKAAYAFLLRKGLWASKSLLLWMNWLESCGLVLFLSDIVVKPSEARSIGQRLNIYK